MSYLLFDEYDDFKGMYNYKKLKELLIHELQDSINENCKDNVDLVKDNVKVLSKLAQEDYTDDNYIIEQLKTFGYGVLDLSLLSSMLTTFQNYYHRESPIIPKDCIEETLNIINERRTLNIINECRR